MGKYVLFFLNSLIAGGLLVLWGLSYVPPSELPFFPSITLGIPILMVVNIGFFVYWILRLSKKCLLSFCILLLCIDFLSSFFQFNIAVDNSVKGIKIKILNYNALHFKGINSNKSFKNDFIDLVKKEKPDMLFLQECYTQDFNGILKEYPYKESTTTKGIDLGANPIYSKFPIINSGSIGLNNVHIGRNVLFVDVKIDADTIRAYNLHLPSYRFAKEAERLQKRGLKSIISRLNKVFRYQEKQSNFVYDHMKTSKLPIFICGDFNNTAYSYIHTKYKKIGNLKDSFVEKGRGFGSTLYFKYFPMRIDFILVPQDSKVIDYKVIKTQDWSDHYPVITEVKL